MDRKLTIIIASDDAGQSDESGTIRFGAFELAAPRLVEGQTHCMM